MKTIYLQTPLGWVRVRKCSSFAHACELLSKMQADAPHSVFRINT